MFVGDIKEAIEKEQLTAAFQKFGTITDIWVAHNPPGDAPKGQPSIECIACSILLPTQVLVDYSLQVSTDKQSQELTRINSHSGFAFVEYETMAEAEEAIKDMHDKELFGGKIRVQLTKSRKPERSTRFQNERESYGPPPRRRPGPYERHERYEHFKLLHYLIPSTEFLLLFFKFSFRL